VNPERAQGLCGKLNNLSAGDFSFQGIKLRSSDPGTNQVHNRNLKAAGGQTAGEQRQSERIAKL
jgi:hypothetical protein